MSLATGTAILSEVYEQVRALTADDLAGKHRVADATHRLLDFANGAPPQLRTPTHMFCLKLIRLASTQSEPEFGLARVEALRIGDIALTVANSLVNS